MATNSSISRSMLHRNEHSMAIFEFYGLPIEREERPHTPTSIVVCWRSIVVRNSRWLDGCRQATSYLFIMLLATQRRNKSELPVRWVAILFLVSFNVVLRQLRSRNIFIEVSRSSDIRNPRVAQAVTVYTVIPWKYCMISVIGAANFVHPVVIDNQRSHHFVAQ